MYKKKVAPDLGPNPHTAPRIRKEVLTPPPPDTPPTHHPPPQKGVPGYGGVGGSKSKNSIAFGGAPRREVDSQPISQLDRPPVCQTETHTLGFLLVADTL